MAKAVDPTYRADLRELNELNFSRFDAKLERRIAELHGDFRTELREVKADLIKWMFVFVAGGTATVLGVLFAVLRQ